MPCTTRVLFGLYGVVSTFFILGSNKILLVICYIQQMLNMCTYVSTEKVFFYSVLENFYSPAVYIFKQ